MNNIEISSSRKKIVRAIILKNEESSNAITTGLVVECNTNEFNLIMLNVPLCPEINKSLLETIAESLKSTFRSFKNFHGFHRHSVYINEGSRANVLYRLRKP